MHLTLQQFSAHLDTSLQGASLHLVERHLGLCETCRDELAALELQDRLLFEALGAETGEEIEALIQLRMEQQVNPQRPKTLRREIERLEFARLERRTREVAQARHEREARIDAERPVEETSAAESVAFENFAPIRELAPTAAPASSAQKTPAPTPVAPPVAAKPSVKPPPVALPHLVVESAIESSVSPAASAPAPAASAATPAASASEPETPAPAPNAESVRVRNARTDAFENVLAADTAAAARELSELELARQGAQLRAEAANAIRAEIEARAMAAVEVQRQAEAEAEAARDAEHAARARAQLQAAQAQRAKLEAERARIEALPVPAAMMVTAAGSKNADEAKDSTRIDRPDRSLRPAARTLVRSYRGRRRSLAIPLVASALLLFVAFDVWLAWENRRLSHLLEPSRPSDGAPAGVTQPTPTLHARVETVPPVSPEPSAEDESTPESSMPVIESPSAEAPAPAPAAHHSRPVAPVRKAVPTRERVATHESNPTREPVATHEPATTHEAVPTPTPKVERPAAVPEVTGLLCGRVRDDNAQPIAGARVILADVGVAAVTDRAGRFCLTAPQGERTVSVVAMGFSAHRQLVTVGRQTQELMVALKPAPLGTSDSARP